MSKTGRPGVREIHRFELAKATIPTEEPPSGYQKKKYHLTRNVPTFSQQWIDREEYLCLCEVFHHCDKQATLHDHYCHFCYGKFPGGCPHILRYYPCDDGWWTIRHQVKRARRAANLPDYEDILPVPCYCGCVIQRNERKGAMDVQLYCDDDR